MTMTTIDQLSERAVLSSVQIAESGDRRERRVPCRSCRMFTTLNVGGVCNLCTPCVHSRLDDDDDDKCNGTAYVWFESRTPLCASCAHESRALYRSPWVIASNGPDGLQLQTRDGLGMPHGRLSAVGVVALRQSMEARLVLRSLRVLGLYSHPFVTDRFDELLVSCCIDGATDHGCCLHPTSRR